jgi:hypothetical protein
MPNAGLALIRAGRPPWSGSSNAGTLRQHQPSAGLPDSGSVPGIEHQEVSMHRPARWAAIIAAGAALVCGTAGAATAAPASATHPVKILRYYAFDINNGTADPGFIPVPGTSPKVFAQGDELIINDQLTTTHKVQGGYPIVGYDAGVCTLTRIPEKNAEQTLANCVVTAVWKSGSLTIQGVVRFKSQQPGQAVLAITGGAGHFTGAAGTVGVSFTKDFKILTITLH